MKSTKRALKNVVYAIAALLFATPAVALPGTSRQSHGVERGRVIFAQDSIVSGPTKVVVGKALAERCSSLNYSFDVTRESIRYVPIDQGHSDNAYSLVIQVKNQQGTSVDWVQLEVMETDISNPSFDPIYVEQLVSAHGTCR